MASIECQRAHARGARLLAVLGAALASCTSLPDAERLDDMPPALLVTAHEAGVRDLRDRYRAAACRRLEHDVCATVLRRLPGEPDGGEVASSPAGASLTDLARRYRIGFVPGFFSECFEGFAKPFADVVRELRAAGFEVDYFQVSGRGSVTRNSARLAEHFLAAAADERPIILFAYSKGLPDVLDFTVRFPDAARRIAAVVSVAGAVNGSPLADNLLQVYRAWVASFPLPGCEPGRGDEIHDLRRDVRLEWWRTYGHAITVPIFSLVAAPEPERVSPGTRATYRNLARVSARNDGKLLWIDQIAPRSYLLGYANADHWAVAIPVAQELPQLAFLFRDDVPRTALVEAAIEIVAEVLASRNAMRGGAAARSGTAGWEAR